ncbi:hypothetical protein BGZ73_001455 [Actinomortierella ambigua]|nr:hypothetical protein BGZ73_001455 [Actinomortierella ambigua]
MDPDDAVVGSMSDKKDFSGMVNSPLQPSREQLPLDYHHRSTALNPPQAWTDHRSCDADDSPCTTPQFQMEARMATLPDIEPQSDMFTSDESDDVSLHRPIEYPFYLTMDELSQGFQSLGNTSDGSLASTDAAHRACLASLATIDVSTLSTLDIMTPQAYPHLRSYLSLGPNHMPATPPCTPLPMDPMNMGLMSLPLAAPSIESSSMTHYQVHAHFGNDDIVHMQHCGTARQGYSHSNLPLGAQGPLLNQAAWATPMLHGMGTSLFYRHSLPPVLSATADLSHLATIAQQNDDEEEEGDADTPVEDNMEETATISEPVLETPVPSYPAPYTAAPFVPSLNRVFPSDTVPYSVVPRTIKPTLGGHQHPRSMVAYSLAAALDSTSSTPPASPAFDGLPPSTTKPDDADNSASSTTRTTTLTTLTTTTTTMTTTTMTKLSTPRIKRHAPKKFKHLYPCKAPNCLQVFARPSSLKAHALKHMAGRNFPCQQCGMSFTRAHDRDRHQKGHGDKAFQCPVCLNLFARQDAVTRHLSDGRKYNACYAVLAARNIKVSDAAAGRVQREALGSEEDINSIWMCIRGELPRKRVMKRRVSRHRPIVESCDTNDNCELEEEERRA